MSSLELNMLTWNVQQDDQRQDSTFEVHGFSSADSLNKRQFECIVNTFNTIFTKIIVYFNAINESHLNIFQLFGQRQLPV